MPVVVRRIVPLRVPLTASKSAPAAATRHRKGQEQRKRGPSVLVSGVQLLALSCGVRCRSEYGCVWAACRIVYRGTAVSVPVAPDKPVDGDEAGDVAQTRKEGYGQDEDGGRAGEVNGDEVAVGRVLLVGVLGVLCKYGGRRERDDSHHHCRGGCLYGFSDGFGVKPR